jgi:hypothetical protein
MKKTTVSIMQGNSRLANSAFKYQEYERPGVSNDEIKEIKEVFDLFDSHRTGIIRPKGTSPFTQTSRKHSILSDLKLPTSQSIT